MLIRPTLLFMLALTVGGCDDAFEGRGALPEEVAAVYGVLDARQTVNPVRLEAVRTEPARPIVPPLLTASLVDETAGRALPVTTRLVDLPDGTRAQIADVGAPVEGGHTYRLDISNADGRTGTARTVVPPARPMVVQAPRQDSLRITQGVVVEGLLAAPAAVTRRYHVVVPPAQNQSAGDTTVLVVDGDLGGIVGGGWRVATDPQRDAPELLGLLGGPLAATVRLIRVEVEVAERSAEWAFAEARTAPHLVRLFGFFAALGVSRVSFVPDEAVVRAAGFRP